MDEAAQALVEFVRAEPGVSAARACKRLGLSRSQLQRLVTALGPPTLIGGLGLLRTEEADDGRVRLWPLE